jgi:ketosteroid isomerase-like protein
MPRPPFWRAYTSLCLTLSACSQTSAKVPGFTEEDATAVRNNLQTYISTDPIDAPDAFFSQFTNDIHWTYADEPPWVGTQGLRDVAWCHTVSAEITPERVDGSGDLAYARGSYRLTLNCAAEGTVNGQGPFLSVHRRQPDGSWRIEALLQPNAAPTTP